MAATIRDPRVPNPEDYHISYDYGFMLPDPLTMLPEYFEPWNKVALNLAQLVENKCLRNEVNKLPELDYQKLEGHRQYRCAHLFLSTVANGYVWQEGDSGVIKILPKQIAVPLYGVASYLRIPPVCLYASIVLANCKVDDEISNIVSTVTFSPREACNWFFVVSALVEYSFAPAIKIITDGLHAVLSDDCEGVKTSLSSLSAILRKMKDALSLMHENLPGNVFYNNLRPFFQGWGGQGSPMPDGLIFEGVSSVPIKVTGGSGAQSSTLQCIDAVLGIHHSPEKREFLFTMKTYMLPAHAQFIDALETGPSLRNFVISCKDPDVQHAYNKTIHSLADFRSYHVQIVSKYVVQQRASQREKKYKSVAEKGTGGTSIMPFLKDLRNATKHATLE